MKIKSEWFAFAVLVYFVCFLGFGCWLYPLNGDDFACLAAVRDDGVVATLCRYYRTWTLRTGDAWALVCYGVTGKWLFNLLLPLTAAAVAWEAGEAALMRRLNLRRSSDAWAFVLLLAGFLICARPRDTFFWMSGACVYLGGLLVWFAFVCIFLRAGSRTHSRAFRAGIFLLGIPAAFAQEYLLMVGAGGLALYFIRRLRRRENPSPAQWSGAAGYLLGCVLFASSPGIWMRAASGAAVPLSDFGVRLARLPELFLFWGYASLGGLATGALFVLMSCYCGKTFARRTLPGALLLFGVSFAVVPLYALLGVSPAMRSYTPAALFALLGAVKLAEALIREGRFGKPVRWVIGFILGSALIWTLSSVPDFLTIDAEQEHRDELIASAREFGVDKLVLPSHSVLRHGFWQYIWMEDITEDAEFWVNRLAAQYYGFDSVHTIVETPAKRFWKQK